MQYESVSWRACHNTDLLTGFAYKYYTVHDSDDDDEADSD